MCDDFRSPTIGPDGIRKSDADRRAILSQTNTWPWNPVSVSETLGPSTSTTSLEYMSAIAGSER